MLRTLHQDSGQTSTSRPGQASAIGLFAGLPVAIGGMLGAAWWSSAALPPVPVPPENPITEPKRVLGKILFWDEQLSTANVVACGSCHIPGRAGADPRQARHPGDDLILNTPDDIVASPGIIRSDAQNDFERDPLFALGPQITGRAANSPVNAAFAPLLFWDGRASGRFVDPQTGAEAIAQGGALESQAVQPPLNNVEMAHADFDWEDMVEKLGRVRPLDLATNLPADVAAVLDSTPTYAELFEAAFGDSTISARRIAFAIATYERTLISDQAPWDRFVAGDQTALTPQQVRGLNALQASNCTVCHTPPLFTNNTFRNIGLRPPNEDTGRMEVTGQPGDLGRFKVASLRNVDLKRTFMHNGQFTTLTV